MENRVPILVFIILTLFFLNFGIAMIESATVPEIQGGFTTVDIEDTSRIDVSAGGFDIFNPIIDFFTINIEGTPHILQVIFATINLIFIGIAVYIAVTIVLDAAPFTGG